MNSGMLDRSPGAGSFLPALHRPQTCACGGGPGPPGPRILGADVRRARGGCSGMTETAKPPPACPSTQVWPPGPVPPAPSLLASSTELLTDSTPSQPEREVLPPPVNTPPTRQAPGPPSMCSTPWPGPVLPLTQRAIHTQAQMRGWPSCGAGKGDGRPPGRPIPCCTWGSAPAWKQPLSVATGRLVSAPATSSRAHPLRKPGRGPADGVSR